jgi:hypothetical protein
MAALKAFIAGFLTLAMLQILHSCGRERLTADPDLNPTVDVESIHRGAQSVEDAFRTADPAAVRAVMTEEARVVYGADLESVTAQMQAFADAVATRHLEIYTESYAEYSYTDGARTLSFALAAQEDGVWKLVRF